uniref:DUF4351 domain-containing protein n=1 Tax=Candidatus Magnetaquicoccus inordinatus TaxID=2496818 RepID=UPI001D0E9338
KGLQAGMEKGLQAGMEKGLQAGMEKGIQEGLAKGRMEGKQEAAAALLLRLLQRRFAVLPESISALLAEASLEQLQLWTERIFDATAVEEIFADSNGP